MENFKEVLKKLKNDISIVFKNIKQLGKAFSEPVEDEPDFETEAIGLGMSQEDIDLLKQASREVEENFKFAHESEESGKGKNKKAIQPKETQLQPEQRNIVKAKTIEYDGRD